MLPSQVQPEELNAYAAADGRRIIDILHALNALASHPQEKWAVTTFTFPQVIRFFDFNDILNALTKFPYLRAVQLPEKIDADSRINSEDKKEEKIEANKTQLYGNAVMSLLNQFISKSHVIEFTNCIDIITSAFRKDFEELAEIHRSPIEYLTHVNPDFQAQRRELILLIQLNIFKLLNIAGLDTLYPAELISTYLIEVVGVGISDMGFDLHAVGYRRDFLYRLAKSLARQQRLQTLELCGTSEDLEGYQCLMSAIQENVGLTSISFFDVTEASADNDQQKMLDIMSTVQERNQRAHERFTNEFLVDFLAGSVSQAKWDFSDWGIAPRAVIKLAQFLSKPKATAEGIIHPQVIILHRKAASAAALEALNAAIESNPLLQLANIEVIDEVISTSLSPQDDELALSKKERQIHSLNRTYRYHPDKGPYGQRTNRVEAQLSSVFHASHTAPLFVNLVLLRVCSPKLFKLPGELLFNWLSFLIPCATVSHFDTASLMRRVEESADAVTRRRRYRPLIAPEVAEHPASEMAAAESNARIDTVTQASVLKLFRKFQEEDRANAASQAAQRIVQARHVDHTYEEKSPRQDRADEAPKAVRSSAQATCEDDSKVGGQASQHSADKPQLKVLFDAAYLERCLRGDNSAQLAIGALTLKAQRKAVSKSGYCGTALLEFTTSQPERTLRWFQINSLLALWLRTSLPRLGAIDQQNLPKYVSCDYQFRLDESAEFANLLRNSAPEQYGANGNILIALLDALVLGENISTTLAQINYFIEPFLYVQTINGDGCKVFKKAFKPLRDKFIREVFTVVSRLYPRGLEQMDADDMDALRDKDVRYISGCLEEAGFDAEMVKTLVCYPEFCTLKRAQLARYRMFTIVHTVYDLMMRQLSYNLIKSGAAASVRDSRLNSYVMSVIADRCYYTLRFVLNKIGASCAWLGDLNIYQMTVFDILGNVGDPRITNYLYRYLELAKIPDAESFAKRHLSHAKLKSSLMHAMNSGNLSTAATMLTKIPDINARDAEGLPAYAPCMRVSRNMFDMVMKKTSCLAKLKEIGMRGEGGKYQEMPDVPNLFVFTPDNQSLIAYFARPRASQQEGSEERLVRHVIQFYKDACAQLFPDDEVGASRFLGRYLSVQRHFTLDTLAHIFVKYHSPTLLKAAHEAGASLNIKNARQYTPFQLACSMYNMDLEQVEALRVKARDRQVQYQNQIKYIEAKLNLIRQMVLYLIEHAPETAGFEVSDDRFAIHDWTNYNDIEVVNALIAARVSLDARDEHGMTPLMREYVRRNDVMVQLLFAGQFNTEVADARGQTLLMLACNHRDVEMVRAILAKNPGTNTDVEDSVGNRALSYLFNPIGKRVSPCQKKILSIFAEYGKDISTLNSRQSQLLIRAADIGDADLVATLLRLGVAADVANVNGITAMKQLCIKQVDLPWGKQARAIMRHLIRYGADPKQRVPIGEREVSLIYFTLFRNMMKSDERLEIRPDLLLMLLKCGAKITSRRTWESVLAQLKIEQDEQDRASEDTKDSTINLCRFYLLEASSREEAYRAVVNVLYEGNYRILAQAPEESKFVFPREMHLYITSLMIKLCLDSKTVIELAEYLESAIVQLCYIYSEQKPNESPYLFIRDSLELLKFVRDGLLQSKEFSSELKTSYIKRANSLVEKLELKMARVEDEELIAKMKADILVFNTASSSYLSEQSKLLRLASRTRLMGASRRVRGGSSFQRHLFPRSPRLSPQVSPHSSRKIPARSPKQLAITSSGYPEYKASPSMDIPGRNSSSRLFAARQAPPSGSAPSSDDEGQMSVARFGSYEESAPEPPPSALSLGTIKYTK